MWVGLAAHVQPLDPASRMDSTREALTAPLHAPRGAPRDRTKPANPMLAVSATDIIPVTHALLCEPLCVLQLLEFLVSVYLTSVKWG